MSRYCTVCGRELTKTSGDIGPRCLQKMKPRNMRQYKITKAQQCKICAKYDLYGENNGSRQNDEASEDLEGQEDGQDGDSCKGTSSKS